MLRSADAEGSNETLPNLQESYISQSHRYIQAMWARVYLYEFHNIKSIDQEHIWTRKVKDQTHDLRFMMCKRPVLNPPRSARNKAQYRECNQTLEGKGARARVFCKIVRHWNLLHGNFHGYAKLLLGD